MKEEKNIEKTIDTANGEGTNNTNNLEKVEQMIKDAAKLTAAWKENREDKTAKTNAIEAGKSIVAALDKVTIEGFIKVSGTWYRKSALKIEDWCKLSDKVGRDEIEAKHGKATALVVCLFDANGMILNDGQGTKCQFAANGGNIWRTKTQLNKEFGIETAGRNVSRDPNQGAIKALSNFAAAIGATFDSSIFEGVDNAAEVILSGAQKFIDNQSNEMKEIARNKKIAAAVATMTAGGKVTNEKAAEYATDLYRDDNELSDGEKAFVIAKVAAGKDYQKAVAAAML